MYRLIAEVCNLLKKAACSVGTLGQGNGEEDLEVYTAKKFNSKISVNSESDTVLHCLKRESTQNRGDSLMQNPLSVKSYS